MASGQPPGTDPLKPWSDVDKVSGPQGTGGPGKAQENAGPLVLSDEERQIMKECERESFYQRGLPVSAGCMVGAHMLVKSGRWTPHPTLGSLPKVLVAGGFGYIIGKMMYLPQCQRKILERIPNSNLAAAIRKSKNMPEPEAAVPNWDDGPSPKSRGVKDDYLPSEGLDDRFRPTLDRDVKPGSSDTQEKTPITYDELRRRNRSEYEDNLGKRPQRPPGAPSYKDSPYMPQKPWPEAGDRSKDPDSLDQPPPPPPSQGPQKRKRTNMWGDPIDE